MPLDCLTETALGQLFDGTLGGEDSARVEEHLDVCAHCRRVVAMATRARAAGGEGGTVEPAVPPELMTTALPRGTPLGQPRSVGRFVVLSRLGEGGMGVVYAAQDPQLGRKVAIKLLPEAAGGAGAERLLREAQALARLSHPNVVGVHEAGLSEGHVFVVMELVDGVTLGNWLLQQRRSQREVLERFLAAGEGLAAAHAIGITHRDFKPDNVLVGHDGRVRVADFGLARLSDSAWGSATQPADPGSPLLVTQTGAVVGTPAYMAPEQFLGQPADARADQFSFCVALWEALYGARPFSGLSTAALQRSVTQGEITQPPREARVSRKLRGLLTRGLAVDPVARHLSLRALLSELRAALPTRPRWPVPAALGAVVALLLVVFARWGSSVFVGTEAGVGGDAHLLSAAERTPVSQASEASGRGGEPAAAAGQRFLSGQALFDLRRFDDAIREWEAGYLLQQDPKFLFEIALAHREAHRQERAALYLRRFLGVAPRSSPNRAEAERLLKLTERAAGAGGKARPGPAPVAPKPSPPAEPPPAPSPRSSRTDDDAMLDPFGRK